MADADLDDFFAKKDKSKKKSSKSKFTAGEILDKKEQPEKKITKKKKEKREQSQNNESVIQTNRKPGDDDEWVDYVDEEEKDYTGLRIQTLQISSKQSDAGEEKENEDNEGSEDEDGEPKQKKETQLGPWKGNHAPPTQPPPEPEPEEPPPKEEVPEPAPAPKKIGKYIPPSLRAAMEAGGTATSTGPPRRKKEAPNIQSEFDFPTLGGEPTSQGSFSSNAHFERVRGGGKQSEDPSRQQQKLELGNKFDALTNAD